MRELHRLDLDRQGAGFRGLTATWLTIAALLGLCLSQPFHNAAPIVSAHGSGHASGHASGHGLDAAALVVAAGRDHPAQRAAHDADLCSLCRATAQARLGIRVSACVGELAAARGCLPLQLPAPELACSAPDLRDAQPRAPPGLRLLGA